MPSYSQAEIISRVRARGIREAYLDDDTLITIIADCLDTYCQYRPKIVLSTTGDYITTVPYQPNYDKPEGALWIIAVGWNPNETSSLIRVPTTDNPTLLLLHYTKISQLRRYYEGHWYILNDQIYLDPVPTSKQKVPLIYATAKTLDDLDTVNDALFLDLVYYTALQAVGASKIAEGGWRAGSYSVDAMVSEQALARAEKKLSEIKVRLANSYMAERS